MGVNLLDDIFGSIGPSSTSAPKNNGMDDLLGGLMTNNASSNIYNSSYLPTPAPASTPGNINVYDSDGLSVVFQCKVPGAGKISLLSHTYTHLSLLICFLFLPAFLHNRSPTWCTNGSSCV